ncbi:MAG TPA: sensor histidine kinase [Anaerolineales bacterium]|nr:sensor histidine kinase [Anaerolineales bacterium]
MNFGFVFIYFIYGLAFFSMGLAMMFEARRSPLLAEARALWPLALFGLVHGAHEWLEMLLDIRSWFDLADPVYISGVRLFMLVISFIFLVVFALQILRPGDRQLSSQNLQIGAIFLAAYVTLSVISSLGHPKTLEHWIAHADVLARYALAVPGAALAALALNREALQARGEKRPGLGNSLQLAAAGFALYSLAQVIVRPLDIFPASSINTTAFYDLVGFPVQAVRAAVALLVTVGLVRASQIVEDERQSQLAAARKARLEAMQQIQRDLQERETLRRELLLHTVNAQEEERGRIARELHDETAQFLTAFTMNLATLQNFAADKPEVGSLVERLQDQSRQMAQGIYRMVHDLRPAQLDDLGLVAALQYLAEKERDRTGLMVNLQVAGRRQRLEPLVEIVVFRVAQEAIANVVRHAQCDRAEICLTFTSKQISLRVQDKGVGFLPKESPGLPPGWGLVGMRERTEAIGGRFALHSIPDKGTSIEITIPLGNTAPLHKQEAADE